MIAQIEIKAKNGPLSGVGSPLKLWEHGGKVYAAGLFKLMDQEGFSLADSLIECKKRGWYPCLDQFRGDALRAGWSREKIDQVIKSAIADSSM